MKIRKIISYILIILAILIFLYEVVVTTLIRTDGYILHLVIILISTLFLIFCLLLSRKKEKLAGILLIIFFVIYPIIQILDPFNNAFCNQNIGIRLLNAYIFFIIPILIPGLLLIIPGKDSLKKK